MPSGKKIFTCLLALMRNLRKKRVDFENAGEQANLFSLKRRAVESGRALVFKKMELSAAFAASLKLLLFACIGTKEPLTTIW